MGNTILCLGKNLNSVLSPVGDIKSKIGNFIPSVNKLISNVHFVQSQVRFKSFQKYCTSFYGCTLWNLDGHEINEINEAWN